MMILTVREIHVPKTTMLDPKYDKKRKLVTNLVTFVSIIIGKNLLPREDEIPQCKYKAHHFDY